MVDVILGPAQAGGGTRVNRFKRIPIRLPGGLIRQFGQWYAVGKDVRGVKRVGVGPTRKEARASLAKVLRAVEGRA